jgi:hypothetical protein
LFFSQLKKNAEHYPGTLFQVLILFNFVQRAEEAGEDRAVLEDGSAQGHPGARPYSRRPQAAGQGQQEPGGRLGGRPSYRGQQVGERVN